MKSHVLVLGLAAGLTACSSNPGPASGPATTASVRPVEAPTATASAASTAQAEAPSATNVVRMYPVQRIYSLFDIVATGGDIEVRLGNDPGGGAVGWFRYVPVVNGVPDIEQETSVVANADTTGYGSLQIAGKRPNLVYHVVSGFRSAGGDGYRMLAADNEWIPYNPGGSSGIGLAMQPWSKDRLLEWRGPQPETVTGTEPFLPRIRVVYGTDKEAPSLPKALEKRLSKAGFYLDTFTVLRTGEVFAVGKLTSDKGFGTLVWKDKLKEPQYFTTETDKDPADLTLSILGGDSAATIRLLADDKVMKLDGNAWAVESTVAKDGLPDVWLGAPMVREIEKKGAFARMAAGAPWMPIEVVSKEKDIQQSFAVDGAGVIWKLEDDMLLSSKPPAAQLADVTEEMLVKARKGSILRGGSDDATGQPPMAFSQSKCSMHYVLLDKSPEKTASADYPAIRAALKGHTEFAKARFVVSKEKGRQFFGAQIEDYETATKIRSLVMKAVKGTPDKVLCAEPAGATELKIDLATGNVGK